MHRTRFWSNIVILTMKKMIISTFFDNSPGRLFHFYIWTWKQVLTFSKKDIKTQKFRLERAWGFSSRAEPTNNLASVAGNKRSIVESLKFCGVAQLPNNRKRILINIIIFCFFALASTKIENSWTWNRT